MTTPGQFTLASQHLGCLPIVNFFLARIGLADHLATYLPSGDARLRLAPAAVIGVVVANIVASHRPVYALGEWAAPYDPAVLGLQAGDAEMLNDDRVGRTLDRLFDADRASLITATVLAVIRDFNVQTAQLHNDSTTVTVTGVYPGADGRDRGGKATPAIVHGHNKDFRPDLKQLLFILTISADGAVPIAYRVAVEQVAAIALTAPGASRWVSFQVTESTEVDHRQERRGRPGSATRYRRTEKTVFTITATIAAEKVAYDAATDGCFPLITNDMVMTPAEVLAAYHYQPNLERRNHMVFACVLAAVSSGWPGLDLRLGIQFR